MNSRSHPSAFAAERQDVSRTLNITIAMARRPASDAYSREFPPLPGERRVRGIAGAIIGALAGALGALWRIPNVDWTDVALGAACSALVFGLLARWLGDAFWRKWIWWLPI